MSLVTRCKELKRELQKRWRQYQTQKLYREVSPYLPIEASQIEKWFENYQHDPHPLKHPFSEIAYICFRTCYHEKAADFYWRYLKIDKDKNIHALYLQSLLLSESATNQSLFKAHRKWAKMHFKLPAKRVLPPLDKNQPVEKIKIGYVCHFFTNSVGVNSLIPLLKRHDKNKFEVYCYDDGESDENTKKLARVWRDIRGKSDEEVAHLIREDGIHILQELNGLCFINRFGALAYQPSPIQINWFNHTSTTGLPFVNYVMSDMISIQDSDLPYFTERAYRHRHFIAAVCFDHERFGDINANPPCVKNGYITFGYFGASHKLTVPVIELWSRILNSMPTAKLLLKCRSYSEEFYKTVFYTHFEKFGVNKEQVVFDGWSEQTETLKKYNEVDIMLDTTAVNGGSTIFEALMQSIPVIAYEGKRWGARSGASVLTTLGHTELIAKSYDHYYELAMALANDVPRITAYRQTLRNEMLQSSLSNMDSYYQNFETAYLSMWQDWQRGYSAA